MCLPYMIPIPLEKNQKKPRKQRTPEIKTSEATYVDPYCLPMFFLGAGTCLHGSSAFWLWWFFHLGGYISTWFYTKKQGWEQRTPSIKTSEARHVDPYCLPMFFLGAGTCLHGSTDYWLEGFFLGLVHIYMVLR